MHAGPAADLIDETVIDGLRAVFGDRTGVLLSRTRQMVTERMGVIAGAGDSEMLARLCHEVGGMAGQVGMVALSREALALETLCRGEDDSAVETAVSSLQRTAAASLRLLPLA